MAQPAVGRRRVKVSATLDPDLIHAIDTYVAARSGLDRSTIIDEALRLWYAEQQDRAVAARYTGGAGEPRPTNGPPGGRFGGRPSSELAGAPLARSCPNRPPGGR